MNTPPQDRPKSPERAEREQRLAKALRDNLRRRKEQARAQVRRAASSDEPQKDDGGPLA